jgi:hypothetical protein
MTSVTDLLNKKSQAVADKHAGNKNTYRPKQAKTTIRILPGWRNDGDPTFFHDYGETWIKTMDKKVLAVVADRKMTFGEEDVVRGLVQGALANAKTDGQREHWKEALASPRVLLNALVLDDKNVNPDEPQIFEFSEAGFTAVINQALDAGISEEFLDLANGFDLVISKTGTGMSTKYSYTFLRKSRSVDESVLEKLNDIDAYIRAKFADSERAVNAIKSLTQSADILQIEDRSVDYAGESNIVDGSFDAVEDAKANAGIESVEVERTIMDSSEIDKLFD